MYMNEPWQQTSVAVATKTKVGLGLTTKLAVSLGVLGVTAALATTSLPGAAEDGTDLFERRTMVTVTVAGSGTVTSSPAGIACSGKCSARFPIGATVILSAKASDSAIFAGWSGACSGDGGCTFIVRSATTISAKFQDKPPAVTLSVTRYGEGRVVSNPGGISCGTDCSEAYPIGTTVTLTAVPSNNMRLATWVGACSGVAPTCVITLSSATTATARFVSTISGS